MATSRPVLTPTDPAFLLPGAKGFAEIPPHSLAPYAFCKGKPKRVSNRLTVSCEIAAPVVKNARNAEGNTQPCSISSSTKGGGRAHHVAFAVAMTPVRSGTAGAPPCNLQPPETRVPSTGTRIAAP